MRNVFLGFFQMRADKTEISMDFYKCILLLLLSFIFSFFVSTNEIFLKLEYFSIFFVKESCSDRSGSHFRLRKQTAAVGS